MNLPYFKQRAPSHSLEGDEPAQCGPCSYLQADGVASNASISRARSAEEGSNARVPSPAADMWLVTKAKHQLGAPSCTDAREANGIVNQTSGPVWPAA